MKFRRAVFSIIVVFAIASSAFAAQERQPVTAEQALNLLKFGNERFVKMELKHPHESIARREDTAVNGQKPFAAVLACSDSRVPVEVIFDRGIGDIFVIRIAGAIAIDPSVIGSAEYAAEHLGTPLLIVMGHTECGAVKAAISGPALGGDIRYIQKKIERVAAQVKTENPGMAGSELVNAVVKRNAFQSKADLLSRSEELREMVNEGTLKIIVAVYDINTGVVTWQE